MGCVQNKQAAGKLESKLDVKDKLKVSELDLHHTAEENGKLCGSPQPVDEV